ncbi:hypothetical protein ACFT6Z_35910, partial [Streptomyces sp. NPDC057131]|uniref:hypothetical protein n=1 Tax=Streptomyces sp. NPDC057131 TaxID=3346027 RepID=UPI00363DFC21
MFKKQHIKYFSFYILICLIIICIGSITGDNANTKVNEVSLLGIKDAVYIFILNSIQIIIWFLLAPFGLSIP